MSTCLKHSTVVGCWNKADNTKENVVIHYTYATNASGVEILKAIRYTISDGTPITLGVGDTVTPGACVVCRKEIFATHDRYITVPSVPAGFVAYEMTNDLPTQGLDVSNSYFHLIYPTLNGVTSDPIGPQLTEYFANPQNGILWSDIAGVQAVIDFVLPLMNLSVGDVVYAINTTNTPIFLLSPTAVAELANNTYLHIYWGDTDVHSSYNETADVNVIAANPNILLGGANKCVGIQEIKEKDTCTGEETYRYVIEDLNGDLVNVTSIYPDFVEADVLLECPAVSKTVDVPNCAGTLVEKEVDSIVGAYILNQENKHTETVYDIVNAAIGGTITYTYTSPTNIALNLNTVTVTNDSLVGFWTDFGDGYNDFGNVPDHSYNADGSYEIKTYAILNSKNKILINAKEVIITNGVVAYAPTGTSSTINRPYRHVVNTALQNYCGNTPVDNPYLADGTSYTPTGTLGLHLDAIIDELEDNAEWNPKKAADIVECEVVSGGGVVTEGVDANLNAISTLLGIPTPDNRHILLGNTLSISSTGSSNIMAAGLNVAATGLITGAQFTFNIDLIADSDPGDPADFGVVVWDNVAGTSVLATSITAPFPMSYDPQGSGLNFPLYANPVAPQSFQVVWTGDLPAGDYTVGYILQGQNAGIGADSVNLSVTHNITAGNTTTTKAQLVALDQCTINALTPAPSVETDLIKTNWLPLCVDGVQWYVSEKSTFDNSTSIESSVTKIYKQGANGVVTNIAPVGTNISEGYCVSSTTCGAVGDVNLIPTKLLSHTEIDAIMFNLLGVNVGKQYADLPSTAFPQTINYQGTIGNIFFGYNLNTSKYKCGTSVIANFTIMYTPLGDADPSPGDTGLDIIFLATNPSAVTLPFNSIISGTAFPPYPTQVITKLYPALPTTVQTIGASYDITGFDSINILSYVQGISAVDKVRIEGIMVEIVSGDFTDCYFVAPVKECNSSSILDAIKQQTAQVTNKIQRVHENYVVTGTTPLVIPSGAISISVTKTNNAGVVNVSGDNATAFPLTFNRENFTDSVNEGYSTLSAYTITGTLAGTTYKVHIIR